MKSDVILINNKGGGTDLALEQVKRSAAYRELDHNKSIQLQLLAEETLSMARIVTGELEATFWVESEGLQFEIHLSTKTIMDKTKRQQLLEVASSRKNEITKSFLGRLRDSFEEALLSDSDREFNAIPDEILADMPNRPIEDLDWDGYERSVLMKLAEYFGVE